MGLFEGFADAIRDALSGASQAVKDTFFNEYTSRSIDSIYSVFELAASPLGLIVWFIHAGVWILQAWLLGLVVVEAFIMGFAILSENPFMKFIEYNSFFIGALIRMAHAFLTLIVRMLAALFNLMPL